MFVNAILVTLVLIVLQLSAQINVVTVDFVKMEHAFALQDTLDFLVNVLLAQVIVIILVHVLMEFVIVEQDLLDLIAHKKFVHNANMEIAVILHRIFVNVRVDGLDMIAQFKHVKFLVVLMDIVTMEHVIVKLDLQETNVHYLHAPHLVLEMVNVLW